MTASPMTDASFSDKPSDAVLLERTAGGDSRRRDFATRHSIILDKATDHVPQEEIRERVRGPPAVDPTSTFLLSTLEWVSSPLSPITLTSAFALDEIL